MVCVAMQSVVPTLGLQTGMSNEGRMFATKYTYLFCSVMRLQTNGLKNFVHHKVTRSITPYLQNHKFSDILISYLAPSISNRPNRLCDSNINVTAGRIIRLPSNVGSQIPFSPTCMCYLHACTPSPAAAFLIKHGCRNAQVPMYFYPNLILHNILSHLNLHSFLNPEIEISCGFTVQTLGQYKSRSRVSVAHFPIG